MPATEAFAARQKVTPDEVSAALDALYERQQAPIDFDLDLSIGQVLDELDLPLPASDLWREVQELRARKAQAAVSPQEAGTSTKPVSLKTGETTRRRWRLAAGTVAAVLAVSVPVLRYARVSAPPSAPPAASPAVSAPRPNAPQTAANSRRQQQTAAPTAPMIPAAARTLQTVPRRTRQLLRRKTASRLPRLCPTAARARPRRQVRTARTSIRKRDRTRRT